MNTLESDAIYYKQMYGSLSERLQRGWESAVGNGLAGGEPDPEYEAASRMDELDSLVIVPSSFRVEGGQLLELQGNSVVDRRMLAVVEKEISELLAALKDKEETGDGITLEDISDQDIEVAVLMARAYDEEVVALHEHDPRFVDDTLYRIATEAEDMLLKAGVDPEEDGTAEIAAQIDAADKMIVFLTEESQDEDPQFAEEARTRLKIARAVRTDLLMHLNANELQRLYALAA